VRSFRLDRIDGEVKVIAGIAETSRPDGLDMLELVRGANQQPGQLARIRVKPGRAGQLRRMAREVQTDEASVADMLIIDYRDADWLSALVAAAGSDVVVLEPPALIKSVVAVLEAAAGGSR
jgi:predicted DNA-binding transcriptional regulator YafY